MSVEPARHSSPTTSSKSKSFEPAGHFQLNRQLNGKNTYTYVKNKVRLASSTFQLNDQLKYIYIYVKIKVNICMPTLEAANGVSKN